MRTTRELDPETSGSAAIPRLGGRTRRILIASDTWKQINGCAHTLRQTVQQLREHGHDVKLLLPDDFRVLPNPVYPDVPLAIPSVSQVAETILEFRPHNIHIVTEGPVGIAARWECARRGWRFTSSFHTLWPSYLRVMVGVPEEIVWRGLTWFHGGAARVMAATPMVEELLQARGIDRIARWSRGIDLSLFRPRPKTTPRSSRPVSLFVGRLSREKNVDGFLALSVPGTKVVVGDGPYRAELERKYAKQIADGRIVFRGFLTGEALASAYADADVFVFPSRTDTFGIVLLEALASGVPIASYPLGAAPELVTCPQLGAIGEDLEDAVRRALAHGDPEVCAERAARYSWQRATESFLRNLVPAGVMSSRRRGALGSPSTSRFALLPSFGV